MNMPKPHFDPTISIGHILTILSLVIGGLWVAGEMRSATVVNAARIAVQEKAIDELKVDNREFRAAIQQLAEAIRDR